MGFQRAIEELRERAEHWEQHGLTASKLNPKGSWKDSIKRAKELKAAADVLETCEAQQWHDVTKHKKDLPDYGERVIICMGHSLNGFVGEGYLKDDGKWYRYCDLDPVEKFMSCKVVGWQKMPKPMPKQEPKPDEFDAEIQPYIDVDVLYIDDLFKQPSHSELRATDAEGKVIFEILNRRMMQNKATIISTEWYLEDELMAFDSGTFSRAYMLAKGFTVSIERGMDKNYRLNGGTHTDG